MSSSRRFEEVDPMDPVPETHTVDTTSPTRSRDRRRPSLQAGRSGRRQSFDAIVGHRHGDSIISDDSAKRYSANSEDGEQDALGLLHGDVLQCPSNYADDSVIDHSSYRQRLKSEVIPVRTARMSVSQQRRRSSEAAALQHQQHSPKLSSPLTSYMSPESPSQTVRPTYAERWVKRQSTYDTYGATGGASPAQFDSRREFDHSDSNEDHYESSNPSSRRTSESSSLADVCFPLEALDEPGKQKSWPDISVLEEFAEEEIAEARKITEASLGLHKSKKSSISSTSPSVSGINFQTPLVSNIDTDGIASVRNLVASSKVDESGPINGRLRPPKTVPWAKGQPKPAFPSPQPPTEFKPAKPQMGQFRFTYFREDLESTIHSTTISGLLQDEITFSDLFVPQHFASSKANSVAMNQSTAASTITKNTARAPTPVQAATNTPTPTPSIINETVVNEPSPFWLDVLDPTEEEMKVLSKAFGIHPLTTEDIFLGETREKVELFKDYYLVCFRSFDVVHERNVMSKMAAKKQGSGSDIDDDYGHKPSWITALLNTLRGKSGYTRLDDEVRSMRSNRRGSSASVASRKRSLDKKKGRHRHKARDGELEPLNMYIIVFREGVLTFHFAPTPHPINVRRRARLLRDYLTVTSDWIGYALIDDITDAFAPMIESIEDEVNAIEDAILVMHSADCSDDESENESDDEFEKPWFRKRNSASDGASMMSSRSKRSTSTSTSSSSSKTRVQEWKKKGDMLRRIGECRKRVMSILRLLGSKADVIKGFAKRCNEQWEVAPRSEIGMYLGDIQDHIVTMVQSLNHYERLLARSHSNYLAQINIDMTRVNNDMNDVLGKITILGTIVLPMNIVTGLWGMNVLVPGQEEDNLVWFVSITSGMIFIALCCYLYAKRVSGLA